MKGGSVEAYLAVLRQYLALLPYILTATWVLWLMMLAWMLVLKLEAHRNWLWNTGWVLWFFSFAYVATLNWDETQDIWTPGWYLDEFYHVLFFFSFVLYLIYRYKKRPGNRSNPISGSRRIWFSVRAVLWTIILGYLWEIGVEYSWDNYFQINFFPWLGKAQKDQADTLIDLFLNPAGALIGIWAYCKFERKFYKWLHEHEFEDAEMDEVLDELQRCIEEAERLSKLISSKKKEFIKDRSRNMLARFRRIFENYFEDNK